MIGRMNVAESKALAETVRGAKHTVIPIRGPVEAVEFAKRARNDFRTISHALKQLDPSFRRQMSGGSNRFNDDVLDDEARVMNYDWPVYYWRKSCVELVNQAATSYPLPSAPTFAVGGADPPPYYPVEPTAMCVFEGDSGPIIRLSGKDARLTALLWMCRIRARDMAAIVSITGFTFASTQGALVASGVWWADSLWCEPSTDDQRAIDQSLDDMSTFAEEHKRLTQWICAASMFAQQHVFEVQPKQVSVGTGRQTAADDADVSIVKVVTLRAVSQHAQSDGQEQDVEWSHRWLVRGHWRNQYFPSRGGTAPIWIHPHVKGPADKPFVVKDTVYAVSR